MIGNELRARRARLGLTQAELGAALGVHANTIAKWERGDQPIQHPRILRLALDALIQDRASFGADDAAWKAHVVSWSQNNWRPAER